MFWDDYIYDEKMDSFQEGVNMFAKCLDLVVAGNTDEEIAAALEEDLEDVQDMIDKARGLWEEIQTMQALAGS